MATEIERKFLVRDERWRLDQNGQQVQGTPFRQGYLSSSAQSTVRVRLEGDKAKLTIKGKTVGVSRSEFEYTIPKQDAEQMLNELCTGPLIEKVRYRCREGDHVWEIDVFEGDNAGLIVAEVELSSESEKFHKPVWLGDEVSEDPRYYNVNLVSHPYKNW